MASNFEFYHAVNNPSHLTGTVGGAIDTQQLSDSINELFVPVDISLEDVSPFYQYRKLWIKQIAGAYSSLTVQLGNLEYPSRYAIATGSADDTATSPTGAPVLAGAFSTGIGASVTLGVGNANDTFPIWLRQTITSGETPDELVSLTFRIIEL